MVTKANSLLKLLRVGAKCSHHKIIVFMWGDRGIS